MGALDDFLISEGLVKKPFSVAREGIELMPIGKYDIKSPEFAKFFGVNEVTEQPSFELYKRLSGSTDLNENPAYEIQDWNPSEEYVKKLAKQGGSIEDLTALGRYQNFYSNWKENQGIEKINKLAQIAQNNPDPVYSFGTNEGPLYRGALNKAGQLPSVGEEFSFGGNRFLSFSPELYTASLFVKGGVPFRDEKGAPASIKRPEGRPTLFQIEQEPADKYRYLITPGPDEAEVLGRPDARYKVTNKQTFSDFVNSSLPYDLDVVKLRQIYGVDPLGSAVVGAKDLLKNNMGGASTGLALSALNPDVAKQVEENNYRQAATTVAKDVSLGALTEAGIKKTIPLAGKYAPAISNVASRVVAPIATGATLFAEGRPGSLTDVITRKAAQKPIPWLPSIKPDPKTDLGARASRAIGNEGKYIWQQLLGGRIPYTGR
jgi:hypothetical protein